MDKRYQVFVSSTFADLQDERQRVMQALMEMDCIPAGMELFPAADEEQWEFIKKVIQDCDYYVIIMGGRHGSLTRVGISYTEMEFDYARSIGLRVLPFVYKNPEALPVNKSEMGAQAQELLAKFREKVCTDRLVKFWTTADELPGLVALSLNKTIKTYPAVGWVRANKLAADVSLQELVSLQRENARLKLEIEKLSGSHQSDAADIASLDELVNVRLEWSGSYKNRTVQESVDYQLQWKQIFGLIAPDLMKQPNEESVNYLLAGAHISIQKGG